MAANVAVQPGQQKATFHELEEFAELKTLGCDQILHRAHTSTIIYYCTASIAWICAGIKSLMI